MLAKYVTAIFARELRSLRRQVEAYPDERQLWETIPGITNPGGTLVLHLTGNLQHYIGRHLGGTTYVRDRPAEFARRNVSRSELLAEIDRAGAAVASLATLGDAALKKEFPEPAANNRVETGDFLVHLACHFAYHLGQIDYHRRTVTGQNTPVAVLPAAELHTARAV